MNKYFLKALSLFIFLFVLESCSNGNSAPVHEIDDQEEAVSNPIFHQERALTVGDSLHIRVLSWGAKESGNYLVLLADSANGHYIGDSFFRNGKIKNTWADDLDKDGWPEIAVIVQQQEEREYTSLKLHELTEGFTYATIPLPPLNETLGADYGGFDTLYRDGKGIVREFSLLDRADSTAQNKNRRRIMYQVENNQLVMGESEVFVEDSGSAE